MTRNEAHPITVEVVRNAIVAYADEMANALSKAAYNMMIYEVRDYCCGLIDTQARMISQNRGGLPIFLADLGVAVADGIARYGLKGFAPGDVIIMNQGEVCGQHLNNVVLYSPCFHGDELVGFAANRAHWVDIGGVRQGFGSYGSSDIYAEGIQMRSLKIYEAGKRNETLWQIIRDNTRYPDAALGDMRAQIASCQLGARRYAELIARYGRETVEACIAKVWDQAEAAARAVVEKIPDGDYEAESFLDNDGRTLDKPLRVKVKVKVRGSQMTVDFSEMNPQVPGPLNSGRGGGIAGARVAFKALTSPDLDVNEGCFRPLEVVLPEGTMLSAKPPSALGLWSIALPTVIDTILKALAPAVPHLIPAAHKGDMGGCSFFGFRDDGSRFLLMNIFGGGWGGRPDEDGEDAAVSVCQGDVRNTPVELQEIKYPVLIETHALRADSGGDGKHRGGLGVELTYQLLQKCKANINLDRTRDPPWGLHGGKPGAVNECLIHRADGARPRSRRRPKSRSRPATGSPSSPPAAAATASRANAPKKKSPATLRRASSAREKTPSTRRSEDVSMQVVLVRVGADLSAGGGSWNGPINPQSNTFAYVPIPETKPVHEGMKKPYADLQPVLSKFDVCLPAHLRGQHMHLDPDFAHLTYGDQGQRAAQLNVLNSGDRLVFYAGLADQRRVSRLVYAIIGMFVIDEIVQAVSLPISARDTNAHCRRILAANAEDSVVRARASVSGRLERCIPIGEWRDKAYRVRPDLIDVWGGLSVKNGYLQRSARIPQISETRLLSTLVRCKTTNLASKQQLKEHNMERIYFYKLTADSNAAPCIRNGLCHWLSASQ